MPLTSDDVEISAIEFYKRVQRDSFKNDYYNRYISFVAKYSPVKARLLELGCGSGMSSALLAQQGFDVIGVDINDSLLQKNYEAGTGRLALVQANATQLPFVNESFEIVCCHEFLEHLPDVPACLNEMLRILRPGGLILIVSPNLLSPLFSILAIANWIRGRSGYKKPFGPPQDSIKGSPWGSSGPDLFKILGRNLWYTLRTITARQAKFFNRQPDFSRPPHGDIDSITLTNPLAFRRFLRRKGFSILKYQGEGKTARFGSFAGGVWIVARKPA